jgi:hypothetical protein
MEITATQVHSGQYRRYGPFYREWEVKTDSTDEKEVLEYCWTNLYKHRRLPDSKEWHANIQVSGAKFHDASYYFAGYYTLEKIPGGYKFTVCEPNTD